MNGTNVDPAGPPARLPRPRRPAGTSGEAAELRMVVTAYGRLSALTAGPAGVEDVARVLGEATGADVAVLGPTLTVLASAGPGGPEDDAVGRLRSHGGRSGLAPLLTAAGAVRRSMTLPGPSGDGAVAVVVPVVTGDDLTAYLVTFTDGAGGEADDAVLLLTEHAAVVCGVVLGRERVVAAAAGRARQDLIEGVLTGRARSAGDIAQWAGHLGFDASREHHVLVAGAHRRGAGEPAPAAEALTTIEAFLARHAPDAIVAARAGEVVAIVPGPSDGALAHVKDLAERCRSATAGRHPGVVTGIGVGGPCPRAEAIAASYDQARQSLETTRRSGGPGGVVAFAELGVQRLLLQVPDTTSLQAFAHEVLGAAVEQDAAGGSEHLRTLSTFLRENCSPRRAAAALFVHPNTVSYRIRRIEDLVGLSMDEYRDRLLAQVAVEILVPQAPA